MAEPAKTSDPTIRKDSYQCLHCGHWTYKEHWGVGRTTCPMLGCGRVAPTAEQYHVMMGEVFRDGQWQFSIEGIPQCRA